MWSRINLWNFLPCRSLDFKAQIAPQDPGGPKSECAIYFLICFEVILYIKIHKYVCSRDSKIHKSWTCYVLVPHRIKPRFYWPQIDQNNPPELSNLLFKNISIKIAQQMTNTRINYFHNVPPQSSIVPGTFPFCEPFCGHVGLGLPWIYVGLGGTFPFQEACLGSLR